MELSKQSAFPLISGKDGEIGTYDGDKGLTKLEYASIEAMKGLLAANAEYQNDSHESDLAHDAILYAKELFKQLEKEQ